MAITYTWRVKRLYVLQTPKEDFVSKIFWECVGVDSDNYFGKISDIITDLKQGESFIAFADLKESDIIGWVKNILGNEYVANVENHIASRINLLKNPPVTAQVKDLPW